MIGDSLHQKFRQQRRASSGILQKPQRLLDNEDCKRLTVKGSLEAWKDKVTPSDNNLDAFIRDTTKRPLSNKNTQPSSTPSDSPNTRVVQNINQYLTSADRRIPNLLNQRDPSEYQRPRNVINPNEFPARAPITLQNPSPAEYLRANNVPNFPLQAQQHPRQHQHQQQQQQQQPTLNAPFPTSQSAGVMRGNYNGWPNNIPVQVPQYSSPPQYVSYACPQNVNQQRVSYPNTNVSFNNQTQTSLPRPMFSLPSLQLQSLSAPHNMAAFQQLTGGVNPQQYVQGQGTLEGGGWTRGNVTYVPAPYPQSMPDSPGATAPPYEDTRSCSIANMPWIPRDTRYITPAPGSMPEPPLFRPMNGPSGGDSGYNPEPPSQAYCRQYEKFKRY